MKKTSVLSSPRLEELKRKKRKIFELKILLAAIGLTVLIFGLFRLARVAKLNISDVEISGNQAIDTETIQSAVDADLTGYYLWIFPKTNFILYPRRKIINDLNAEFPRLEDISLGLKNPTTLYVSVSERTAQYIWCGANPPTASSADATNNGADNTYDNPQCYYLDENGFVFETAPYFSGNVYLKFYGLNGLNENSPIGSYFAPDIFEKLISFQTAAIEMGLQPTAFYLLDSGDIQMLLAGGSSTENPPEVIFNTSSDFGTLEENLQTALSAEPLQTDMKNKYSSLQYIDLRFGNKVYYKFGVAGAAAASQ